MDPIIDWIGGIIAGIVLASVLITLAGLLAHMIARRLGFKPFNNPFGDDAHGDVPAIPDDFKAFHAARYSEGVQHGRS